MQKYVVCIGTSLFAVGALVCLAVFAAHPGLPTSLEERVAKLEIEHESAERQIDALKDLVDRLGNLMEQQRSSN
jgi:hypothetical protein